MSGFQSPSKSNRRPEVSQDPVLRKVSWEPLHPGGSNFQTQYLITGKARARVVPSLAILAFFAIPILAGAVMIMGWTPLLLLDRQFDSSTIFLVLFGLALLLVGLLGVASLTFRQLRIDMRSHLLGYGRQRSRTIDGRRRPTRRPIEVHALQILGKEVWRSKGGSYACYELNLVFDDAERSSVLNHGDLCAIRGAAHRLSRLLGVSVVESPGLPDSPPRGVRTVSKVVGAFSVIATVIWVYNGFYSAGEPGDGATAANPNFTHPIPSHRDSVIEEAMSRFPVDAFKPEFCTVNSAPSTGADDEFRLSGKTRMSIERAARRIRDEMAGSQWLFEEQIRQTDAIVLFYGNGNQSLDYTLLLRDGRENSCRMRWSVEGL